MALADNPISVTELRSRLSEVLSRAQRGSRYTILSNSDAVAVLIGVAEWRMLNETLEILLDKGMVEQIRESEEAIESNKTQPAEDILRSIENELGPEGEPK